MAISFLPGLRLVIVTLVTGAGFAASAQSLPDPTPLPYEQGQGLFVAACASCHYRGADKTPFGTRGPPADASADELTRYILFGKSPEGDEGMMPAFGPVLTDADITQLVTWLRTTARPDAPWPDVAANVAAMRANGSRED